LFIHRKFFSARSPKLAGIFSVLLPSIWAVLPALVLFFLNNLSHRSMERNQLGSIFNLLFNVQNIEQKVAHLVCAAAWLLLMVILNASWFFRQISQFKPLDAATEPMPPVRATAPPPIPGQMVGK
jgi:hypothetical protein